MRPWSNARHGRVQEGPAVPDALQVGTHDPGLGIAGEIAQQIGRINVNAVSIADQGTKAETQALAHAYHVRREPTALRKEGHIARRGREIDSGQ